MEIKINLTEEEIKDALISEVNKSLRKIARRYSERYVVERITDTAVSEEIAKISPIFISEMLQNDTEIRERLLKGIKTRIKRTIRDFSED